MNSSNLQKQKARFSVAITTEGYQNLIRNTLGDPERAKRFVAAITSAVAVNPALQDCDAGTILAGGLLGESLGLSPSPQLGQYFLVPFECKVKDQNGKVVYELGPDGQTLKDKNGRWIARTEKKAQFVLGYKGYIQMAARSGRYRRLNVIEIKEGEIQRFDPLNEEIDYLQIEDFDAREEAGTAGYYAMFETTEGFRKAVYWSRKKMVSHADRYSPAFSAQAYRRLQNGEIPEKDLWKYSSFWYKDFDAMAKKTMLRQILSKWGVLTDKLETAYTRDNSFLAIGPGDAIIGELPEVALASPDPEESDEPEILPGPAAEPEQVNLNDL